MNADRRAVICSAFLRIKCRGEGLDEAIQAALSVHKAKASAWDLQILRRDVESALYIRGPDKPGQLEITI